MDCPEGELAALSLVEAALEAWAECQPDGYLLPERCALALLFTLGAHLPSDERSLGARAQRLEALVPVSDGIHGVGALNLPAKDGKVHLLHFWRAYSEVARLVAAPSSGGEEGATASQPAQGSVAELERLRDVALGILEASDEHTMKASALAEALQVIARTSAVPAFWTQVAQSIGPDSIVQELGMEELTVLLLSWLHDAVMWQEAPGQTLQTNMLPAFLPDDATEPSMITVSSVDPAIGTLLPSALQNLNLKTSSRPSSQHQTLRPPSQVQTLRPNCSLMASGALLLDLEEQWRVSGALGVPDKNRPYSRSAMLASTPIGSPRSPSQTTLLPEPPSGARTLSSEKAFSSGPPSPIRPPDIGPGSPEIAEPPGPPVPLQVENFHTAVMPLPTTPRPAEPSEVEVLTGSLGLPVNLHIYDVSQEASIRRLNALLANRKMPIKLGGVFHAAVEVDGAEWSFGRTVDQTSTGVTKSNPRADPNHHFRETVSLPATQLSKEEVAELVAELRQEYLGQHYHLLRKNCCHFADDFCQRLGVGRIPAWVYRLARIGARIDSVLKPMQGRGLNSVASASVPSQSPSQSASGACGRREEEEAPLLT